MTDVAAELSQVLEAHTVYTDGETEEKEKCVTYVYGNGLVYEYGTEEKESDREENKQEGSGAEQEETVTSEQETESRAGNQQTAGILVHHYNNIGSTTKLTNEYGEVFDLINATWYAKECRYEMAALCTIAAVPLFGSVASGTLTMFKCAKAAKYVQAVTKVVCNAATFMLATGGNISSIKTIYHNIKNGEIFTKENLYECGAIVVNTFNYDTFGKEFGIVGERAWRNA